MNASARYGYEQTRRGSYVRTDDRPIISLGHGVVQTYGWIFVSKSGFFGAVGASVLN